MLKGISTNHRLLFAILILTSCTVLFFDLGGRGFQNKDYLCFAETAREMMFTGDYIVPHYAGKIYLAKPPLLMWSIAISSQLNGIITPFTARIPSALCALLSIITVYLFGKRLYKNPLAGFWAGLILLSNYMFFLSISQCKSARYILPLYPALSVIICGMRASISGAETNNTYLKKWVKYALVIVLGIILMLSIGFPVYTYTHYSELFPVGIAVGIFFSAGIVCRFFVKKLQILQALICLIRYLNRFKRMNSILMKCPTSAFRL